ncbi:M48 family metalloprotease [Mycolicibacterium phocaicum]|uniref:M48 family metalloprotease n=1 Tax=Mycolicibacterium phocaicum TaxID=319706 RepID=UPI001F31A7D4|nr:M48 family metalloprotease [Mycolicibacterium phocaicum]
MPAWLQPRGAAGRATRAAPAHRRRARARLGAAAWLTAIISVLASWVAAAAITIVELVRHWGHLDRLIVSCLMWLCRAASGAVDSTAQAVVIGALAAAGAGAAIAAVRVVRAAGLLRHRAREHARDVRLVGRATADADVVVIDAPQPAAYCVTGRPGAIVFTSAALAALDDRQRAAVLAHERAHLAGHHLTVMVGMRALARVFPACC